MVLSQKSVVAGGDIQPSADEQPDDLRYTFTVLKTFQIHRNLAALGQMSEHEAFNALHTASGCESWARQMLPLRSFVLVDDFLKAAESVWFSMPPAEWIDAFSVKEPTDADRDPVFRVYADKFGFPFILFDAGLAVQAERAAVCRARLGNSAATELQIAGEEFWKMIERRLADLLER